jgi:ABC-2 type transport system ATP-binding protein
MPQTVQAVRGLTAHQQVAYTGWMQGLSRSSAWAEARECLDRVGLVDQATTPSTQLSGGQLRRVGLAEAMVSQPDTLILDEPTVGLDPAERARFRSLLGQIVGSAGTVIVSTHQVDDLSEQFDRVAVMIDGTVAYEGTVAEFLRHGQDGPELHRAESAYATVLQTGEQ